MTVFRDTFLNAPDLAMAIGGLLLGVLFGALAEAAGYCAMGAVSDWRLMGDKSRLGAVALAAAVAVIGAQSLDAAGVTDLSKSIYLTPRLTFATAIAGGFIFGLGMAFAGGCPSRLLVRGGGGDIRALATLLVLSLAALATLSGILGTTRVAAENATAIDLQSRGFGTQSLTEFLPFVGGHGTFSRLAGIVLVAGPLIWFAFGPARILSSPRYVVAGLGVGAIVSLGWALTGLAYDEMSARPTAIASLSFVKPVADAIDWLERATALGLPGFAATSVAGVIAGSFLSALIARRLNFSGFADRADLGRHFLGAIAMGAGGILAMGCSIGQGVTGLSTLALQSIPTVAAMLAGAVAGLEILKRRI